MTKEPNPKIWDVIVIGGGPAGMMAAGRAAERGKSVLLLEKNDRLGEKLLITGGGRCNVTNNKPDVRIMLSQYRGNDKFLFSAFSQFAVTETIQFFRKRRLGFVEENDGRLFPVTHKARSVWDVLVKYIQEHGVVVRPNAPVVGIAITDGLVTLTLKNKSSVQTKTCIIATGGTSHPETGSTGDAYKWLKKLGHTIIENNFALVPIALKDVWAKKLGGVSLSNIKLTTVQDDITQTSYKGKLLFTHFGISGPAVLNMSKDVGDLLQYGSVKILVDLFPTLDHGTLKKKLHDLLTADNNKKLKNTLGRLIPPGLVPAILELTRVDGETVNTHLRADARMAIVKLLKELPLHVEGLLGSDKAVITSGGVALEEVNFKTMQSRLHPELYLIGDVLNVDRPSGGYSLQLCWTTGFVAGDTCK